jgi:glycosyltransferase involved in cell wall biosynthesis
LEKEKLELNISGLNADLNNESAKLRDFIALYEIKNALEKINFELTTLDINCLVNVSFGSPDMHTFMPNAYNIFYSAVDKENISEDDIVSLNRANEVWTPSSINFEALKSLLSVPVYKIPFGVSGTFLPTKRKISDVFSFLHVGEQDGKSNTDQVVAAFIQEFGHNENVTLTLKSRSEEPWIIIDDGNGNYVSPDYIYKNIKIINDTLFPSEYVNLLHTHNCLVSAAQDKSFGFIPLEAIATGMPVISTYDWSDYSELIEYKIDSPSISNIAQSMKKAYSNRIEDAENCFYKSFKAHREWQWDEIFINNSIKRLKFAHNYELGNE